MIEELESILCDHFNCTKGIANMVANLISDCLNKNYEIKRKVNDDCAPETRCPRCLEFFEVKIIGNKVEGQCQNCDYRLCIGE